jgi:diacylglycerol kinase (ATP)
VTTELGRAAGDARSVAVILNANAGQKLRGPLASDVESNVREALQAAGMRAQIHSTRSSEEAERVVGELVRSGSQLIVAAGGDGTVGRVGSVLVGSDVVLGMMPLGSVMNIARMLGLPRDLEGAARAIAAARVAAIDVGEANGEFFYETASVGLNAAVFREMQRIEDGDWGSPLRAVAAAFRYRPARMEIALDGDRVVPVRGLMVAVSNGGYTGAAIPVAPDAQLDDGLLDVRVFKHFSKFELLRHLVSITLGTRRYIPHTDEYRSATVRVTSRRKLPARADSNDLGSTPLDCRVLPASLNVIVGPDFANGRVRSPEAPSTTAAER